MNAPATPALIIDLPTVRRNVDRMAIYARRHGLSLRPHFKTHKSLAMAALQLQAGAVGLTCAKVGEAEVASAVCDDLFVAYPALDESRCERIAVLAAEKSLRVALDSDYAVNAVADAGKTAGRDIGVLVEIDVGFARTGVQSPQAALELAQHTVCTDGVRLDGIMFFPGQLTCPADEQTGALRAIAELLDETLDLWRRSGLEAKVVSGGSTPTACRMHLIPSVTEIRPGTYIYNDMNTASRGHCTLDDCATRVLCTVVSNAVPGKVVIDAGSKALSSDRFGAEATFGGVVEYPRAKIVRLTEEHGELDISNCPRAPALGERVSVIPNHVCPCVNCYDTAYLRRDDGELEPTPIDARGRLS